MFQGARDTGMLGRTLSALVETEHARGHSDAAISLERDALRYSYLAGDVTGIAVSYHNLGSNLHVHARQLGPALASHLAAAVIRVLAGIEGTSAGSSADSVRRAARRDAARGQKPETCRCSPWQYLCRAQNRSTSCRASAPLFGEIPGISLRSGLVRPGKSGGGHVCERHAVMSLPPRNPGSSA